MKGAHPARRLPFVTRRLLQVVPTVVGILLISFLLVHLAPGDPLLALAGEHGDAAYYADMRQRFGLDEPIPRQLLIYMQRVAVGDLGFSYVQGRSAAALILDRAPATLLLTGSALFIAIVVAVPLGAIGGRRPHSVRDLGITIAALGISSSPTFFVGQAALLVVALRFGLTPVQGMMETGSDATGLARIADVLRHLFLPALVLASQEVAVFVRLTRSGVIEEFARDHVRTARAKGVRERAVLLRHVLPRALLPVVTVIGARAGHLVAGAAVVEIVFGWPGMGRLMLGALQTRDEPVLLAVFLVVAFAVIVANLVTDLAYAAIDPRVRVE